MKIIAAFAVGLALASALSTAPAQAQNTRTFVSPTGNDAAACSLAAPCRTFVAAYALTNAGGEIAVLGTAGYGMLTISKAISIVNGGGFEAGIAVPSSGTGITINAGTNDAVSLRGLTIDGAGVGQTGIAFNGGKSLTVENCVIRHMTSDGIDFLSGTATSALAVANSLVADNGNDGILVKPTGSAKVVFSHVETNNNISSGIEVNAANSTGTNTINASVTDSVANGNGFVGYIAVAQSGQAPTDLMVIRSLAAGNTYGVAPQGSSATTRLANSALTGNANGWVESGGTMRSYGDNYIDGNAANETAPTSTARK